MKLWRISNYATLDGGGGLRAGGRWHNRGIPVVYLAESPALAMLEILVNFDQDESEIPKGYQLLEIDRPEDVTISRLSEKALCEAWEHNQEHTRGIGDEWLSTGGTALMAVPSAVAPNSYNYLLNPRHPDAKRLSIVSRQTHLFDSRLVGPK